MAVLGMWATSLVTAVVVGVYVGTMANDLKSLRERLDQTYQQNLMLTATVTQLGPLVARLSEKIDDTRSLVNQERQDRIDGERRIMSR